MNTLTAIRFIAEEIICSVAANSLASLYDRLEHSQTHDTEEQAQIARYLRDCLVDAYDQIQDREEGEVPK